jgi:hypothetical protein
MSNNPSHLNPSCSWPRSKLYYLKFGSLSLYSFPLFFWNFTIMCVGVDFFLPILPKIHWVSRICGFSFVLEKFWPFSSIFLSLFFLDLKCMLDVLVLFIVSLSLCFSIFYMIYLSWQNYEWFLLSYVPLS